MSTAASAFLGSGWAWPPRLTPGGGVALVSDVDAVERSIELILRTEPGERPMRPGFGCALHDFVFAPADRTTAGRLERAVARALEQWEPRILVERVSALPVPDDAAVLRVDVAYVLRTTNDRRNLVFPFYVLPDESR